ncbi:uncharacterized protein LOC128040401 [Gossypium raimondii]|uniref:uncharacterized protein LOC128040401 n=1 Tax=Gossypium raimondii TaxID=29730 RepID=UPI00227B3D61|nr:uncharacterized protein LOC128040401 [Gossypium raimondii]
MAKCKMIACVMWAIWTSRNRFIHEGEMKSGSQIAGFVINYLKELDGLSIHLLVRRTHMERWVALNGLRVKINFDAAFNRQRNESCSGLVVRNERAEVICSRTIMHVNILSAFAAEVMACLQALNLGLHLGLREIKIEGDSHSVIRKLQAEEEDRSEIEAYIKDSKQLSLGFGSCAFRFIHRESNKVAHIIATEGIKKSETTYLMHMVPSGVEGAVDADRRWTESMRE